MMKTARSTCCGLFFAFIRNFSDFRNKEIPETPNSA